MPLQATSGAASYDAFGGGAPAGGLANYIEDVFSTYLYLGTNSAQTITNGIDLAGKGGLIWQKQRTSAIRHRLFSTALALGDELASNLTSAVTNAGNVTAYSSTGFSIGSNISDVGETYVTWTLRKQPKFFDIVTYTGNSVAGRTIAHNLGSVPGCIIVKCTSAGTFWSVYHRSTGGTQVGLLNATSSFSASSAYWNDTDPTSTVFTVGITGNVNDSGQTYVAYLFAHDAGGFGLTGTDNVISCGSYTGNGSATGPTVSLGYEPQWLLIKQSSTSGNDWNLIDNMRGFAVGGTDAELNPNLSDAESTGTFVTPNATGFQLNTTNAGYNASSETYVYIAIRRGPMKVPTSGTSVFAPVASNASTGTSLTTNFPIDLQMAALRPGNAGNTTFSTRLTGINSQNTAVLTPYLVSRTAAAETTGSVTRYWTNTGFQMPGAFAGTDTIFWNLQRAPSVFDVVCYIATSSSASVTHNLTVRPEMIIYKTRSDVDGWYVMVNQNGYGEINGGGGAWGGTGNGNGLTNIAQATSTTINNLGGFFYSAGQTIIAYLFATCAGVSKVGSYTGNGSSQTINCGFTSGSRFVLIKRIDASGGWHVWDSARGIVAGNDPYVLLNTAAAEVTTDDSVDTDSTGFVVNQVTATNINVTSATYIFLAIA
jgi:hypothetical protein